MPRDPPPVVSTRPSRIVTVASPDPLLLAARPWPLLPVVLTTELACETVTATLPAVAALLRVAPTPLLVVTTEPPVRLTVRSPVPEWLPVRPRTPVPVASRVAPAVMVTVTSPVPPCAPRTTPPVPPVLDREPPVTAMRTLPVPLVRLPWMA